MQRNRVIRSTVSFIHYSLFYLVKSCSIAFFDLMLACIMFIYSICSKLFQLCNLIKYIEPSSSFQFLQSAFNRAIWSNTSNWIMFIYSISSKHVQLFNLLVGAPVPDHYCPHSLIMVALRAGCRYQHTFLETQSIAASLSADVIISQLIHLRPHHPHDFQLTMNAHKQDHLDQKMKRS